MFVGREGRRERKWWASSYQVSPNIVMCAHASSHLHISIPTHPHTYSSPPTSSYPHAHPHTYISSSPHPLSMNLHFLTGDMEVVCKNGVNSQLSYNIVMIVIHLSFPVLLNVSVPFYNHIFYFSHSLDLITTANRITTSVM